MATTTILPHVLAVAFLMALAAVLAVLGFCAGVLWERGDAYAFWPGSEKVTEQVKAAARALTPPEKPEEKREQPAKDPNNRVRPQARI